MTTSLIKQTTITEVCSYRDASLMTMKQALDLMKQGLELAATSDKYAQMAHGLAVFTHEDRSKYAAYKRIFEGIDTDKSYKAFREQVDARTWMNLLTLSGMTNMMDKTAKDQLYAQLMKSIPEVTEDNILSTFEGLSVDAKLIFQRGLARAFIELDRRFKSHDAFKIGSRIILTRVFNEWGSWSYHGRMQDTIIDVERVFSVLDGNKPNPRALLDAINKDRGNGLNPRQSVTESEYFKIRTFQNGNAHLWFTRDDLVAKANLVLAEYYGAVLPDGVSADVTDEDLHKKTDAICKNLSFYATPSKVIDIILDNVYFDQQSIVLEPSAGTGNIVKAILASDVGVIHAVEVDYDRLNLLQSIKDSRLGVKHANFLQMTPNPQYTHVIMNPPFYGNHYMQHIMHAFEFLSKGGTLVSILPSTVEFGETKDHEVFRAWCKKHTGCYSTVFQTLPLESFADSGTRVNTCYVTLRK